MLIRLAIFAKDPDQGPVKTRLAKGLGQDAATAFYRESLRLTLARLQGLSDAFEPVVMLSPEAGLGDFAERFGWPHAVRPQGDGDLGARLKRAWEDAPAGAIVVGTDVPELSPGVIRAAEVHLDHGHVPFGPCPDGGYYLLGSRRLHAELFQDIPWSTSEVAATTASRAEDAGVRLVHLPELADIDHREDLEALDGRLAGRGPLGELVRDTLAKAAP
jgi:rSAM/selenodomain-associated transferase 1